MVPRHAAAWAAPRLAALAGHLEPPAGPAASAAAAPITVAVLGGTRPMPALSFCCTRSTPLSPIPAGLPKWTLGRVTAAYIDSVYRLSLGGTGHIGSYLCPRLAADPRYRCICVSRSATSDPYEADGGSW